jgi:hypothetical protein
MLFYITVKITVTVTVTVKVTQTSCWLGLQTGFFYHVAGLFNFVGSIMEVSNITIASRNVWTLQQKICDLKWPNCETPILILFDIWLH